MQTKIQDMWLCILCSSSISAIPEVGSSDVLLIILIEKLNFQETRNKTLNTKIVDLTVMKTCSLISNFFNWKYNDDVQVNIQTDKTRTTNMTKHIISVLTTYLSWLYASIITIIIFCIALKNFACVLIILMMIPKTQKQYYLRKRQI